MHSRSSMFNLAPLSSEVLLFISFYLATYKKDGKRPSGRKAVRRMSQAPLPDPIHGSAANANYGNGNNGDAKSTGVKTNGTAIRSRRA